MDEVLRRRLLRGLGASGMGQAVGVITQLAMVPVLVRCWGSPTYGEWLMLNAIPAYLAMSDLGLGTVTGNEMVMMIGRQDRSSAMRLFQSTWCLITLLSAAIALAAAGLVLSVPVGSWINVHRIPEGDVAIILVALSIYSLSSLQDSLMGAGFNCAQKYSTHVACSSLIRLAEASAVIGVAAAGGRPATAAVSMVAVRLAGLFGKRRVLRGAAPWLVYRCRGVDFSTAAGLARPALTFLGMPLGHLINLQGTVVAINLVLGPTAVVVYTAHRTLSRLAFQVVNSASLVVWPEVSRAYGEGDMSLARLLHRKACQFALWASLALTAFLAASGPIVISNWTRHEVAFDPVLFGVLLAGIIANALWYVSSAVSAATNQHAFAAGSYVACSCGALAASAAAMPAFGLAGLACSSLVAEALMILLVVRRSLHLLGDDLGSFAQTVGRPPFVRYTPARS